MEDSSLAGKASRRKFLIASALMAASATAAACAPAAAPTATPAPAKPTEAPKPAAEAPKPAVEPTKPAAEAPKPAAEATKPAAAPAKPTEPAKPVEAAAVKPVARNRTMIESFGGADGKFTDYNIWNPYAIGGTHQLGVNLMVEPVAFYSAFADKMHMWLAESFKYSPDFKELVIKTRSGITWSDGKPFSAEDVAYTLSTLKDLGPRVNRGVEVQKFVQEAKATDANTVSVKLKIPAPRFFFNLAYKFDLGTYIVPKHVFDGQDWTKLTHFDMAKGWPVTTGPWQLVFASPDQKLLDRRGQWWAAASGIASMPKMERVIYLPKVGDSQLAQALIANQVDHGFLIVQVIKQAITQSPKLTTHTGREAPFGYTDWWPLSLYVNHTRKPFDDKDVRWAISYFLDRKQIIEVGYGGAGSLWPLPLPSYPPLRPYADAVKPLLDKYPTLDFNPKRGEELLTGKGFKKNPAGMWTDSAGGELKMNILGFSFMSNIGPVIAEQLKRAGINAQFSAPVDAFDQFSKGTYEACIFGHGGSVADPYDTLVLYQTASMAIPGDQPANFPRWKNEAYDKIVDEVYFTPMEEKAKLLELFKKAMEIWLPELPDIQLVEFYHNIALN